MNEQVSRTITARAPRGENKRLEIYVLGHRDPPGTRQRYPCLGGQERRTSYQSRKN